MSNPAPQFPCSGCGEPATEDLCPSCKDEHEPDYLSWLDSFAEAERERAGTAYYPTPGPKWRNVS